MIIEQTKDKKSIWAEVISSCSPATGEWDSECRIYDRKRLIATLDDGIMGNELCIRGKFDYREDGKDDDGYPNLVDDALYLSIEELNILKEIIEHWEDDELHKEKWEEIEK